MSTRCDVDCGPNHHLHARIFEAGKVYLELTDVEFTANPRGVMVAIPAEVWEKIRVHGIEEFRRHWYFDGDDEGESPAMMSTDVDGPV